MFSGNPQEIDVIWQELPFPAARMAATSRAVSG
jgi:hypothetical protein